MPSWPRFALSALLSALLLAGPLAGAAPVRASQPLGLPADSFPPLTGSAALETQAKITLETPLTLRAGYRGDATGALAGGAADGTPIRLSGSVTFAAAADGSVSATILWTRRAGQEGALSAALVSRARAPRDTIVPGGTALTVVGDIDALRAGIPGFAASLDQRVRGGCPDLVHYSRGAVVAQTRTYKSDAKGRTLYNDCSPDVGAGLWRIERDYRGCDWMPADQDKIYPAYRLVYRPLGDNGPLLQIQSCLPDQQRPSAPFGITIGGCVQRPVIAPGGQGGSSTAAQRYGWTTPDGVYRGLTPCLHPIPVTLNHQARACSGAMDGFMGNVWGVTMSEIHVQTDADASTYRKLLPCGPWGVPEGTVEKDARACAGQYYDDMAGGVSWPMVRYGVRRQGGGENAVEMFSPITQCLPDIDPQKLIQHGERQVGWQHADGILASFPVMQRTRDGVDIGQPYIGDPAQHYALDSEGVADAGPPEVVGCVSFQARQLVRRYHRPDDSAVDVLGLYDAPVITDKCAR
ncbi:hypothetical protein [Azospirillum canadense]|uniref:hypothetical protein n=1 Tax=Azospirillum canadense TaxID=403962 RepID=UPI002227EEB9|nr:hypothetical protein [Azospirillum canadense]MCW2242532.1 hypothetical protein [Azospirillum canadense]